MCYVFYHLFVVRSCYLLFLCFLVVVFFFKQKTAYELRISDWSSDVCSSDLQAVVVVVVAALLGVSMTWNPIKLLGVVAVVVLGSAFFEIGRASCRERVCQYV